MMLIFVAVAAEGLAPCRWRWQDQDRMVVVADFVYVLQPRSRFGSHLAQIVCLTSPLSAQKPRAPSAPRLKDRQRRLAGGVK